MNHQAIAHRGLAGGRPPPRAGTLSTARLSHARKAIAVAIVTTSETRVTVSLAARRTSRSACETAPDAMPARFSWTTTAMTSEKTEVSAAAASSSWVIRPRVEDGRYGDIGAASAAPGGWSDI
jgi:hypothetical protein